MSFWFLLVLGSFCINLYGLFTDHKIDEQNLREAIFTLRLAMGIYLICLLATFHKLGW